MKISTIIQYDNLEVDEKNIINNIKQLWSSQGKKLKDIKDIQLYIKPTERTVYYVINSESTGSLALCTVLIRKHDIYRVFLC